MFKLKRAVRYLHGRRRGVQLFKWQKRPTRLVCETDSDWAGCSKTQKSTSGMIVTSLGTPIYHCSRTQNTVALSSAEAELYTIGAGTCEGSHVKHFRIETRLSDSVHLLLGTDLNAGKSMATRVGTGKRSTYVEISYLYMPDLISREALSSSRNKGLITSATF